MTALGWLALAFALALAGNAVSGPGAMVRLDALVRAQRLPGPANSARAMRMRAWGQRLEQAGVPVLVVAAAVVGWRVGLLTAVAAGAIAVTAWTAVTGARRRTARRRDDAARRAAISILVEELAVGSLPPAALAAAAQAGGSSSASFRDAAACAERGDDPARALLADKRVRPVGLAWRIGEQTGTALAAVLSRVATDLDAVQAQHRHVSVALAGPRSSAAVLTGLPVLGVLLGVAMDAKPMDFLFGAPLGQAVCCAGVLLDVAGVVWMRRILQRAEAS